MNDEMKLKVIQEIMDDLQSQMEMGRDDFDERLGRKKPDIEIQEEVIGKDLDGDMEMGEDPEHMETVLGDDESPEDKLKSRIMKMRG